MDCPECNSNDTRELHRMKYHVRWLCNKCGFSFLKHILWSKEDDEVEEKIEYEEAG